MKNTILTILSALLISGTALARGGAIGGGEVEKYPLYSCVAQSIDPTYPSQVSQVVVHGEADDNGFLIPDMSVTIELRDAAGSGVVYLPTMTLPRDFDPAYLETYQYAQTLPGEANPLLATMHVRGTSGSLAPSGAVTYIKELQLTDCEYVAVASHK